MSDSRWQRIEEIFHQAAELAPQARPVFLDQACAGDEPLRKEIESLLAHEAEEGSTLAQAVVEAGGAAGSMDEDLSGRTIGPYKVLGRIGEGGMGVVYRARDSRLGRDVALKVLPAEVVGDASRRQRFEKEARAVAALNHPNICTLYDVGPNYLVMELIEGQTLAERIAGGPIQLKEALEIACQIAEALEAAHEKGVVHRDLKPANIKLTATGKVKVLDFGLAKVGTRQVDAAATTETLSARTEPGLVMGTVGYMSPEQVSGLSVDQRTDLFSFGVVLYEMVTRKRPFTGSSAMAVCGAILHTEPRGFGDSLAPGTLKAIIRKLLEKDPANRHASAEQVHRELKALETSLAPARTLRLSSRAWIMVVATVVLAGVLAGWLWRGSLRVHPAGLMYTRLTDFTDSAVAPALSPDGRLVAFIRGSVTFLTADQIYVKALPDGEARRLTDDPRLKYNLAFSPDGSQIAYTVLEPPYWATYTVSVLGGDSHLLLNNAAGLTWLDQHQLLYSQIRSGMHMGIVTGTVTHENFHEIYFPPHERAMAHYSYASPDRKSALVIEMDKEGGWAPCRLIALDGRSQGGPIGPQGACTSAGWAPDGSWMYFTVMVEGQGHLWRQRFPNGQPEQITLGPTEEEGVAVERDGRSVITSMGAHESAIWIHDAEGERPLSSEGEIIADISPPSFGADDSILYYLLRRGPASSGPELWRLVVESGKSEAVFPGVSMLAYDVSPDGQQVVYTTAAPGGKSQLWLAPIDRRSPAKRIGDSGATSPHFGPRGQILFQLTEGNFNYLEQMNPDGSGRSKVVQYPISEVQGISPGRRWVMAIVPNADRYGVGLMAIPMDGGPARRMCTGPCVSTWSSSGKFLFISVEAASRMGPGRSFAIPAGPGESLPEFPPEGIKPLAEASVVPGAQSVPRADLVPGKDPSHFAYVSTTAHRNLYRVSLP